MTIPRRLDPETAERAALPDYSRSSATVERMISALEAPGGPGARHASGRAGVRGDAARGGAADGGSADGGSVRALFPAHATRDTAVRSAVAACLLGTALVAVLLVVLLGASPADGRSPGAGLLVVMLALGTLALLLGALGLRFALAALGTARARVEISERGLRVVGALGRRDVAWDDVVAIESRVVHPVHWLTAALRLRDGSRVVMPAFDRAVWTYTRPTGQDVRALRIELHRHQKASRRPF